MPPKDDDFIDAVRAMKDAIERKEIFPEPEECFAIAQILFVMTGHVKGANIPLATWYARHGVERMATIANAELKIKAP